jgi:hypothetical protein
MDRADRNIPGWTAGDLRHAVEGWWPRIPFRGTVVEGEAAWLEALATATPDEIEALRAALPDDESGTGVDPGHDQDDDDEADDAERLAEHD